jgi:uncharacterized caspase-like protein
MRIRCLLLLLISAINLQGQTAMSEWKYVSFPTKSYQSNSFEETGKQDEFLNDIPTGKKHPERYALIIGNEHYNNYKLGLRDVSYAVRDAKLFRAYAEQYWGVPASNLFYLEDATAGIMEAYVERLALILRTAPLDAEIYFYFAGHGMNPSNSKSFLPAPVDADPQNTKSTYTFHSLVAKLCRNSELKVVAFTDACFSGFDRNGNGSIAARGVEYRLVAGVLPEGVVHFAAARQKEYAYAWEEKKHGLFTAVLFENLKNSSASINWQELSTKVQLQVMEKASRLKFASQEPLLSGHPATLEQFKKQKVKN